MAAPTITAKDKGRIIVSPYPKTAKYMALHTSPHVLQLSAIIKMSIFVNATSLESPGLLANPLNQCEILFMVRKGDVSLR